jgi:teichuronic acid biosynthesis glycosyltransferase TuaG
METDMTKLKRGYISIIVPVYNAEKFIEETIRYVQAQTYTEWELLLVDDCSSDRSREVIRDKIKQDERIKLIEQDKNSGAAASRNLGLSKAQGRYICFLDADDVWEPEKLDTELGFMQEMQAGFVFMGYEFADENGKGLGKVVHVPGTITYRQALKNTTIFTSTVMIDREIIPDEDIVMPNVASEDTATWWNILKKHGKGYGLDKNLVRYRRSANTLSSNKMTAIKRIWGLYRRYEGLSFIESLYCMAFWAFRAVLRRI